MLLYAILIGLVVADVKDEKVTYLPPFDLSQFNFSMYSGYLQIANGAQQFHYVFVESELGIDDHDIPLVLWLNGGPGCSSMMGLLMEIGPFVFLNDGDMELSENALSWNKVAHLLFLESPSGVGFSINPQQLTFNDQQTAEDNLAALLEFFTNFPWAQKNPFWIAGESYAGVYIPMLAQQVDSFNAQGLAFIDLKGVLIGNGVTNLTELMVSQLQYLYEHQFLPPTCQDNIDVCSKDVKSYECKQFIRCSDDLLKHLNPYSTYCLQLDVYGYCWHGDQSWNQYGRYYLTSFAQVEPKQMNIPCTQFGNIETYLNRNDVQEELHVVSNGGWYLCAPGDTFKYTSNPTAAMESLQYLLEEGKYTILLFNGDNDSVVPWIDTLKQIPKLNVQIKEEWRPYYVKDNQLGGFTQGYSNGLRFMTVRGAGHMVPQDDREIGFYLFNQTVSNSQL